MRDSPSKSVELLVLGATGLLGQAMLAEAQTRGVSCVGVARTGAQHNIDICDPARLVELVHSTEPSTIINCAAMTDVGACETQPGAAYTLNARTPALLAELSTALQITLVQISSDHFFTGDGHATHDEHAKVQLVNEYARTKYAGETFALTAPSSLVLRTNIVGARGWPGRPTFAEWAIDALEHTRPITLFNDFFTSSMHSRACAAATLDLLQVGAHGLVNVASSQVASKQQFVEALAAAAGMAMPSASSGSVRDLTPLRAESLGLNVAHAEALLGRRLPDLHNTVSALLDEHRSRAHCSSSTSFDATHISS